MDTATIKRYAKFVVAAAGAVGVAASVVVNGDLDTTQGIVSVIVAVAAAFGVKQIPNAN
jgi:hypothetical protein